MSNILTRIDAMLASAAPELRMDRISRMQQDAFSFFRGACRFYFEDLRDEVAGVLPRSCPAWICGDLHMANFGAYKGATGAVYFDINDFDEAVLAPAIWDVARAATSILVYGHCHEIERSALEAATAYLDSYAATLAAGKAIYIDAQIAPAGLIAAVLQESINSDRSKLIRKLTVESDGERMFDLDAEDEGLIKLPDGERLALLKFVQEALTSGQLPDLQKYSATDAVFRVAGTGSVGCRRYMILIRRPENEDYKYRILDMKEAGPSGFAETFHDLPQQPQWRSHAERIIAVQERMQAVSPKLLQAVHYDSADFVVQERQPEKKKMDLKTLKKEELVLLGTCMGQMTAYAQLRSSGRDGAATADELIAFGRNKADWKPATLEYAIGYAKTTDSHWCTLQQRSGG